jgi:integrase
MSWLKARRAVGGVDGHPCGDESGVAAADFRGAWTSTLELAGIDNNEKGIDGDLHWHDLRHECGSRLAERGVDVRRIQELLGHTSLATTQRYLNTDANAVGAAMKTAMGW